MYDDYEDLGHVYLAANANADDDDSNNNSDIRILQLTDLHMFPKDCEVWDGISLGDSYQQCLDLVQTLVTDTRPDLIVLTGDIIDGRGPWKSADRVTESVQDLMVHCFPNTPWLFIPGNHDDDHSPWTRSDLLRILQLPGCLQQNARGFNHTLTLSQQAQHHQQPHNGNDKSSLRLRLHLFDSGGNSSNPKHMYYPTSAKTIASFLRYTQSYIPPSNEIGLCFIHIPTPEYQGVDPITGHNHLFEAALVGGKIPSPLDKLAWLIRLLKLNRIAGCTRGPDTGLFRALMEASSSSTSSNANMNKFLRWPWSASHPGPPPPRPEQDHHQQQHQEDDNDDDEWEPLTNGLQSTLQQPSTTKMNITALFCGHDHHSDAMFYNRQHHFFYGYGRSAATTPPYDWEGKAPNVLLPGARVVQVTPQGNVTTWIQNQHEKEADSFLDMTNYEPPTTCGGCFHPCS
jgi:hypothetical protein